MNDELKLKNNLKEARAEKKLSQTQLAELIGVSRNTISSRAIQSDRKAGIDPLHCSGQEI